MPARQSYVADRKVIEASRATLLVALGRLFHSHRVAADLSQAELGAAIGPLRAPSISAVENGEGADADHVAMVGKHLGVEPRYIAMYEGLVRVDAT